MAGERHGYKEHTSLASSPGTERGRKRDDNLRENKYGTDRLAGVKTFPYSNGLEE